VTFALARSLIIADAVAPEALGHALLLSATRGASLVRALLAADAIEPSLLEQHLERGEAPSMRHIAPVAYLVQSLPPGLCDRLLALPVRRDPRTGTVDVAVVDARDSHAADEISYWLKAPVRVVRTSLASMEVALRRLDAMPEHGMRPLAPPMGEPVLPEVGESSSAAEEVAAGPNIPIPLTRRSLMPLSGGEVGPPAIEREGPRSRSNDGEPVLDLNRRKGLGPASEAPVGEAPATQRGPFPGSAVAFAPEPASGLIEKMNQAQDRDRILELLISGVAAVARSVVVLAIRRDAIVGWAGSPGVGDRASVRDLRMPSATRTALNEGLDHEGIRLVRLPGDLLHAPLAALLGIPPASAVAIGALRVEGKPAMVVVASGFGDSVRAMSHMADLTPAAGDALARLLRERRK
jgi:hypothetical protein